MKYLFIISLILLRVVAFSQSTTFLQTDSLHRALLVARDDTTRVLLMANLTEGYRGSKPDSAILYAHKALELAREIKFPRGEVSALLGISVVLRELGSLAKALDFALKALAIAEKNNMVLEKGFCFLRIANVYTASKNYREAQNYYHKADETLKSTSDHFAIGASHFLSADVYEKMNILDSALYKANLSYGNAIKLKDEVVWPGLLRVYGNIYSKKGNNQLALQYYHQSLQNALKLKDHRNSSAVFADLSGFYKKRGNIDSAIYYGKSALEYAQALSYKGYEMRAANLLSDLYEITEPKEALRYYKIANDAKDSLYSSEKVQALQTMTFEEQERQKEQQAAAIAYQNRVKQYALLGGLAIFLIIALMLYRNNRSKQKANLLLHEQKKEIQTTLSELKTTQAQLIQSEKMASLGELTAGIAHEIQNPLNFVNNFSETNSELIDEMKVELDKGNLEDVKALADNIKENQQKITHHGKRADTIVKGMLLHSRTGSAVKEPTDINALADEYLRLAYHGVRAKEKSFNPILKTEYDNSITRIHIIPQDIGRVLLNLYSNAFYSMNQKSKQQLVDYEPTLSVSTKKIKASADYPTAPGKIELLLKDNGSGIPQKVLDKIFQPFFTTKPPGEGTGLGLSLSYDIIKAHGGEIMVKTKEGEGTEFIITLPANGF